MRGGTANCSVNVSSRRIGSPLVETPNALVVMNQPSLDAFEAEVAPGGVLLLDNGIVEGQVKRTDIRVVAIPATEIADEVGTPKVANVVMLGALCAATGAFPLEFVEQTLREVVKKKNLVEMNITALRRGFEHVAKG
jgi:2-oxoglutarate ferredoxin oxidoreductase subunit gamma